MDIKIRDSYYFRLLTSAIFVFLTIAGIAFAVYIIMIAANIYMESFGFFMLALALISGFFNCISAYFYFKSYFYEGYLKKINAALRPLGRVPTVAVGMPIYNEDPKVVKKNLLRLRQMNYPKGKMVLYLLDDSTKPEIRAELKGFAEKNGIKYLTREGRKGFKAGNLNNMLKHSKEEFVAVFDYDEYLTDKNFLVDTIKYFHDPMVGYVQTEKSSFDGNFLSDSVNLFDAFFYRFIQPARAFSNTAIFSGSCGIIRRSVLDLVGGFPEYIIEDTFFSFESDVHHYKGLFLPKVYAYGKPMLNFSAVIKQQWRYNYGDTQFIFYFLRKRKDNRLKKLSARCTAEWTSHGFGLNYLSVMLLLFTITSVIIVFYNLPFLHINIFKLGFSTRGTLLDLELFGVFAFALSLCTPAILTKVYFNSARKGFMIFLLNFSLVVVRTKAAIAALLGIDPSHVWSRTKGANKSNLLYSIYKTKYEIALALLLFGFSVLAFLSKNYGGGTWLIFYGVLYLGATAMIYKYG